MKKMGKLLIGVLVVSIALLAMLGEFWIIYLAPLLIFVGVGITYGFLSSKPRARSSSTEDRIFFK